MDGLELELGLTGIPTGVTKERCLNDILVRKFLFLNTFTNTRFIVY